MNTLFTICFLCLVAIGINGQPLNVQDSVQVQVYYESLCPYSIAFIVKQLYPAFATIGSAKINLELIPWGHASETAVNGTKTFTCQHGEEECYANKIHACAIDLFDINASTKFISCAEGSIFPADDADLKECANNVGISWCEIEGCIGSGRGDALLSEYGQKTAVINPRSVPTIVIDATYSDENQSAAETHFMSLVCNLLGNPTPEC